MSDFYIYRRGGWLMAIDAISRWDAQQYVKLFIPDAEYIGKGINIAPKTATGITTSKRQEEIISNNLRSNYGE